MFANLAVTDCRKVICVMLGSCHLLNVHTKFYEIQLFGSPFYQYYIISKTGKARNGSPRNIDSTCHRVEIYQCPDLGHPVSHSVGIGDSFFKHPAC